MRRSKYIGLLLSFFFFSFLLQAQVSTIKSDRACINCQTGEPNSSAALDIISDDRGILIPRLDDTTVVSNPTLGLLIFDKSVNTFQYYNGTAWIQIGRDTDNEIDFNNFYDYLCNTDVVANISQPFSTAECGRLYDTGGQAGNYSDNEDEFFGINTFNNSEVCPLRIRVIIESLDVEDNRDTLFIENIPFFTDINTPDTLEFSENVLVRFKSDEAINAGGFSIRWESLVYSGGNSINASSLGFFYNAEQQSVGGGIEIDSAWTKIGKRSLLLGYGGRASGERSNAVGYLNEATNINSSAFGYFNEATGVSGSAFGYANNATELNSNAFGRTNNALEVQSSAFGYSNSALEASSSAFGYRNLVMATNSSGFGYLNEVTAANSSAFGYSNQAFGDSSSAFGYGNLAEETQSSAFGHNNQATNSLSNTFGYNNQASGSSSNTFGHSNTASASFGSAFGYSNEVTAANSSAFGYSNEAMAINSSAFGYSNQAIGESSSALGYNNIAQENLSSAFGHNNQATNLLTNAFGYNNQASGSSSSTFGHSNTASASFSSAFGYLNEVTERNSSAFGYSNQALGELSNAFGHGNITEGNSSSALGYNNLASGASSSAFGYSNNALQSFSSAFGHSNQASGTRSSAFGHSNNVSGAHSSAFGFNTESNVFGLTIIGISNEIPTGSPTEWISTDPVFAIGNGENGSSRSTALTILKNGNTGIGTTTPDFLLDVAGDGQFSKVGTLSAPQLTLNQEAGDFARMRFTNDNSFASGNNDFFAIQANVKPASGGDGRFHISYQDNGGITNVFTIQAEGSTREAGINTNTPNYTWEVNGTAGKPGGGDWSNASDRRLKKDVEKFEDGLEQVLKIRPVWYRYNGSYGMPTKEKYVGIIAQEMQKVAPYTITPYLATDEKTGNQKEFLSYNGTAVTYMLVNAIQEQQEMIEKQQEMIEAKDDLVENLQKQNQALEARLSKLESIILDQSNTQNNTTSTLTSAKLEQNNPNPFKGKTNIQYSIPEGTNTATLRITDANGRVIKEIPITAIGEGQIELGTSTLGVGNYFYSLLLDGQLFETKQMILQR